MYEHWLNKRKRSQGMTNQFLNQVYDAAIANGALGGKLVGAGGGGFLMFYSEDKKTLRQEMSKYKLQEMKFRFSFNGVEKLINQ